MKKKKIPMRKDLLTSTMQPKKELVRVAVDKDRNISVDPTGKESGRGAYVSLEPDKIVETKKNQVLEKSLGVKISADSYDDLYIYIDHQKAGKELFGDK